MSLTRLTINEGTLWSSVKQGDRAAFEMLYKIFFKPLYNYGRKVCSNATLVEDSIHDLFLDLWRYRENLSATSSIKFYLFRALRRKIVKNGEKDEQASVFSFNQEDFFSKKTVSHEEDMIALESQNDQVRTLKRHLNNLSPRQYESLILRFYDDFSYSEIGSILNVNEQSARNLVQRGLEQLRNLSKIVFSLLFFVILFFR
ncbi:MAG: sigma-70 family RNA polymerase sigma factor [Cyclobacteriaceae bacterium]|nr:sigma-70 family RNA polymerase sigma factor [Cyclobacteriaceae bacterium]